MKHILVKSPIFYRNGDYLTRYHNPVICPDFIDNFFGRVPHKMRLVLSSKWIKGGKTIELSIGGSFFKGFDGLICVKEAGYSEKKPVFTRLFLYLKPYLTKKSRKFYLKMIDLDREHKRES